MSLVKFILSEKFKEAKDTFSSVVKDIIERKKVDMKKALVAEMYGPDYELVETIVEGKRINIVRARIRNGKVQRRKRVSAIKGYTIRKKGGGPAKLIRMGPLERRRRKLGARRGKIKRRGKMARIQQKMRRVRLKRKSLGLGSKNKVY